jgi:hypothetical protein
MSRTDAFRAAIAAGFVALADDPPKKNPRRR